MIRMHLRTGSPKRILVAEDEHLVAVEIAAMLEEAGYVVVGPVGDGRRAIELCREAMPDMALVDMKMPDIGGLEAAGVIYKEFGVPVVVLTAHAEQQDITSAADAGVSGFLVKPVTTRQLHATIQVAWSRFAEAAALAEKASDLGKRLEERRVIEQAKWLIVKSRSITEPEAMKLLQDRSRTTRKPMVEIARGIIESAELLG